MCFKEGKGNFRWLMCGARTVVAAHLSPARRTSIPGCESVAALFTSTGLVGGMVGRSTCTAQHSAARLYTTFLL
jgi:hypothetical protein